MLFYHSSKLSCQNFLENEAREIEEKRKKRQELYQILIVVFSMLGSVGQTAKQVFTAGLI